MARNPYGGRGSGNVSVTGVPQLLNKVSDFIDYVKSEVLMKVAEETAADMEAYLKEAAPWDDRTGEARRSLKAVAFADFQTSRIGTTPIQNVAAVGIVGRPASGSYGVRIVVYGEAEQNKWLEIAMGARFAIIGPSLMPWGAILKQRLDAAFRSL